MDKIYLLLRNNQQTGPYTKEELDQMNLQSHDLIWMEGRSTGWQAPEEITALAHNVKGAPQTSQFLTAEPGTREDQNTFSKIEKINAVKKPSDKLIYVSLPRDKNVQDPATGQQETFDERVAKMKHRINAISMGHSDDTDTKYTRSLEEIKEEYSSWLHEKKVKGKKLSNEQLFISSIIILGIAALGYFTFSNNNDEFIPLNFDIAAKEEPSSSSIAQSSNGNQVTMPVQQEGLNQQEDLNFTPQKDFPVSKEDVLVNPPAHSNNVTSSNNNDRFINNRAQSTPGSDISVTSKKAGVIPPSNKNVVQSTATPSTTINEEPIVNRPILNNKIEKQPSIQTSLPGTKTTVNSTDKKVPVPIYVSLKGKTITGAKKDGVKGYEIRLENAGNYFLRVVAVDVFYYSKEGNILDKKILYFSNVQPRSINTIVAPANKNAATMQHQLGLISSEQGLYYAKQ